MPPERTAAQLAIALATGIGDKVGMKPYEMIQCRVIRTDDGLRMAPAEPPPALRTWTGWCAYIPGELGAVKTRAANVRISFTSDFIPDKGGIWVFAGYSDLERIVKALRP